MYYIIICIILCVIFCLLLLQVMFNVTNSVLKMNGLNNDDYLATRPPPSLSQMYSCGSLAPKMKRGGGCMDHQFHKPTQPWEKSEG